MSDESNTGQAWYQRVGLFIGPLLAVAVFFGFRPEGLPPEGTRTAAIAALMAIWWASEAAPVAVTAFLPIILFPIFGVAQINDTLPAYSHPIVYLFLGGFVIALAIERSGLHKRVALQVFKSAGVNGRSLVGGFMAAAALISMWISNTSTTLMLLPIAMSVIVVVRETMKELPEIEKERFETSMLLGLAYGATLGGVATLVGTPPNAFMAGFMETTYGVEIDFARWMMVGVPVALVMLPVTWLILTRIMYPVSFIAGADTKSHIRSMETELGRASKAEIRIGFIFVALVAGWLLRKPVADLTGAQELTDAGIAMIAAVAAFLTPSGRKGEALMTWADTTRLPWGVLILFGGGLALASGMTSSGLTEWLGGQLAPLGSVHIALLIIAAAAMVIFLTELTSNLATTATFLPVMAAIAVETGQDPLVFVIPVSLAASCAFMLPVATPPNAIVFSSGRLSIPKMMRAGMVLNLIGVAVLSIVALTLAPAVFQ